MLLCDFKCQKMLIVLLVVYFVTIEIQMMSSLSVACLDQIRLSWQAPFAIVDTYKRLYLAKVLHGLMDHDSVKISIYDIDVFFSKFKWRDRHSVPVLALLVTDHSNETVDTLKNLPGPNTPVNAPESLMTEACGSPDRFSIYH